MNVNRWLYAGGRPNCIARVLNRGWAFIFGAGIWPTRLNRLEVRGRRTGKIESLPVVVADYDGERYLVSMLGNDASWVRNVKASGGKAVLRHGDSERVALEAVATAKRAPILKRYLEVAPGARPHFPIGEDATLTEFRKIASSYPVFRIRAV